MVKRCEQSSLKSVGLLYHISQEPAEGCSEEQEVWPDEGYVVSPHESQEWPEKMNQPMRSCGLNTLKYRKTSL